MTSFTEPTWSESELVDTESGAAGDSEILFTFVLGAVLEILQWHFSSADTIVDPLLKDLLWTSTKTTTALRVLLSFSEDDPTSQQPALVVKPLPVSTEKTTDLRRSGIVVSGTDIDSTRHFNFINGKAAIICRSVNGGQSLQLAEEVYRFFLGFAPWIRADLQLSDFKVQGFEGPVKDEKRKVYETVVAVSWQQEKVWTLEVEQVY